jgi:hypothetical protein
MNSESLLKTVEKLFLVKYVEGLNDIQMVVLQSSLTGASYSQIASRLTYSVEYLRDVGAKLWQILSGLIGESVSKKNLRSVLERYQQSAVLADLDRKYFCRGIA